MIVPATRKQRTTKSGVQTGLAAARTSVRPSAAGISPRRRNEAARRARPPECAPASPMGGECSTWSDTQLPAGEDALAGPVDLVVGSPRRLVASGRTLGLIGRPGGPLLAVVGHKGLEIMPMPAVARLSAMSPGRRRSASTWAGRRCWSGSSTPTPRSLWESRERSTGPGRGRAGRAAGARARARRARHARAWPRSASASRRRSTASAASRSRRSTCRSPTCRSAT